MAEDKITAAAASCTAVIQSLVERNGAELERFAGQVVAKFHQGHRLFLLGSGSLGALAAVVANTFLYRLSLDRPSLPAMALCHDAVLATSLANGGAVRQYFSRQLRAAANGDVVLAFAEGHHDEALAEGLAAARQLGCLTAVLASEAGDWFGETPDFFFALETDAPARLAEGALFFGHLLCELVERELFGI